MKALDILWIFLFGFGAGLIFTSWVLNLFDLRPEVREFIRVYGYEVGFIAAGIGIIGNVLESLSK